MPEMDGQFLPGESVAEWDRRLNRLRRHEQEVVAGQAYFTAEQLRSVLGLGEAQEDFSLRYPRLADYHASIDARFQRSVGPDIETALLALLPLLPPEQRANAALSTHLLLEANRQRQIGSMLCVPTEQSPRGLVSYTRFIHANTVTKTLTPAAVEANADFFPLLHALKEQDVYLESPPYDAAGYFAKQSADQCIIPGSQTRIYSAAGQERLLHDRAALCTVLSQTHAPFDRLFWHQQSTTIHGIQPGPDHLLTQEWVRREYAKMSAINPYTQPLDLLYNKGMRAGLAGKILIISPPTSNAVLWQGDLPRMIQDLTDFCTTTEDYARLNRRRERQVIERMSESLAQGRTPHVFFGAEHAYEVMRRCADQGWAVMLNVATSMPRRDAEIGFYANAWNPQYNILTKEVLPTIQTWR